MEQAATLPGTTDDEPPPVICHVDMDCFYAACERRRDPTLRGEPVVVGMGYDAEDPAGAVATASYEARKFGVESAMAISEALECLPRRAAVADDPTLEPSETGHYRPVDMAYYEGVAEEVRSILRDYADVTREGSIDEAYLDVSERLSWDADVTEFGRDLKGRIGDRVGVTASVGVAPTMSAAKIASDYDKPDGLVVVPPGEVREFLGPLDVEAVHGVGPVTAAAFREEGIETAGDLAAADPGTIEDRFGERGLAVRRYARGEDDRSVEPVGDPKSLSRESAFSDPVESAADVRSRVRTLAEAVAGRATRKDALYRTIGIKVVEPPFDVNTREHSLPGPVDDPTLVEEVALDLLGEFEDARVRKVGVRVSNLEFTGEDQVSLAEWEASAGADAQPGADGAELGAESRVRHGQLTLLDFL